MGPVSRCLLLTLKRAQEWRVGAVSKATCSAVSTAELFLWILASILILREDRGRDKGDRARHRRHPYLPKLHQHLPTALELLSKGLPSALHTRHTADETHTRALYTLLDDSHHVSRHTSRPSMLNYGLWAAAFLLPDRYS